MRALLLATLLLLPSWASADPTANFTVTKMGASTCVAPCAVHFDAWGNTDAGTTETTDPDVTRDGHSLLYLWDFDDPNSGNWTIGALFEAGLTDSKNVDKGPLAGHVYEDAGTYTVTLTVRNPNGEEDTTTEQVEVVSPASHFAAADTYCFARDDLDWTGCPLDCTTSDNCTVVTSATTALTSGDQCNGTDDCANADAGMRWVHFRRGDTFTYNGISTDLFASDTSPGLIQAFGTDPEQPSIQGEMDLDSGWTLWDIEVQGITNGFSGEPTYDHAFFYQITADAGTGVAMDFNSLFTSGVVNRYSNAIIESTFVSGGENYYGCKYCLNMGNTWDSNGFDPINNYMLRGQQMQNTLWSRNEVVDPVNGGVTWNFRTMDEETSGTVNQEANERNLFQYNVSEVRLSSTSDVLNLCPDSGCNCVNATAIDCTLNVACVGGDLGSGETARLQDWIFDSNLYRASGTGSAGSFPRIYRLYGANITVRNDIVKIDDGISAGSSFTFVAAGGDTIGVQTKTGGASCTGAGNVEVDGDVSIFNNSIFVSTTNYSGAVTVCGRDTSGGQQTGCPDGVCACYNNHVTVTSSSGASLSVNAQFTHDSTNRLSTSDLFDGAMPARGSGAADDFIPSSGSAIENGGRDFNAATDTSFWNYVDARGLCRPDITLDEWDQGALERDGYDCTEGDLTPVRVEGTKARGSSFNGVLLR